MRLKRVLHHANEPAAFLQISCHDSEWDSVTSSAAVVVKGGRSLSLVALVQAAV